MSWSAFAIATPSSEPAAFAASAQVQVEA